MNAQRHAMAMVFTAATLAFAGSAMAGVKASVPLQIDLPGRVVIGSLASTYNSSDTKSTLGCTLQGGADSSFPQAIGCTAKNSSGTQAMCYITNPPQAMVNVVLNLSESSVLMFQWDDKGKCTGMSSSKDSFVRPRGL